MANKMKKYRLLIFDFDGTLVDTAPDIALHANAVLKEFKLKEQSLVTVKNAIGHGVHELLKELGVSPDDERLESAVASFKRCYREKPVIHTKAYSGVHETLSAPLKKFHKAIVTNKPYGLTVQILNKLSLAAYFNMVIGLDMDYPAKPDPLSTRRVIEQFGADPEKTLFIGDSPVDAETCRNAGIDFAWVDYGYASLNDTYEPVMKFSSAFDWKSLRI